MNIAICEVSGHSISPALVAHDRPKMSAETEKRGEVEKGYVSQKKRVMDNAQPVVLVLT
jgi:hypothetical protein